MCQRTRPVADGINDGLYEDMIIFNRVVEEGWFDIIFSFSAHEDWMDDWREKDKKETYPGYLTKRFTEANSTYDSIFAKRLITRVSKKCVASMECPEFSRSVAERAYLVYRFKADKGEYRFQIPTLPLSCLVTVTGKGNAPPVEILQPRQYLVLKRSDKFKAVFKDRDVLAQHYPEAVLPWPNENEDDLSLKRLTFDAEEYLAMYAQGAI